MNAENDPQAAELDRIETELTAQNRRLSELIESARAGENELFQIPRADLEALAEACAPRRAPARLKIDTAIRC